MATTLSTLRDDTYAILNELQTSNLYSTAFIDLVLNDEQTDLCTKTKWSFLRTSTMTYAPVKTGLTGDITPASTTLLVTNTTNYATAGAVRVNHNVISYTNKTSTSLTGCTGIVVNHNEGSVVEPLIAVPLDYLRMPEIMVQKSRGAQFLDYTYIDELNEYDVADVVFRYTMVTTSTNVAYFLVNVTSPTDLLDIHYLKMPTVMEEDADLATIPDPYARKILPKMAASKAMLLRGDDLDGLGSKLDALARLEILAMQKYYGDREQSLRGLVTNKYKSGIPNTSTYSRPWLLR